MSSRRHFLAGAAAALLPAARLPGAQGQPSSPTLVDYHVHLNTWTLEDAVNASRERGVKFGIVEHAGTKENQYPTVISNDAELQAWIAKLDSSPVFKGVQAEWIDWMPCFSTDVFSQLDYVLSDSMTVRDANGRRLKAFGRDYDPGNDAEAFMKMYVDWNVEILERTPLDIFAHPTWVPGKFNRDFDRLWTAERMQKIVDAMKRTGTACEIDCGIRMPKLPFLRMAKDAGVKFSFGSNAGGRAVPDIGWSVEQAKTLGLGPADMFQPAARNRKPIRTRKLRA